MGQHAVPGPSAPPPVDERRVRWAAAENQKRAADYQAALAQWAHADSELAWMIQVAQTGSGYSPEQVGSNLVPKRGETVFANIPACKLVEVKRAPGQYRGGYSGFSFRVVKGIRFNVGGSRGTFVQGAEGLKITDEGSATVTNQRVVFQGVLNSREWAYSKLIGVEHDPHKPISLIHVSNRQKVSGLAYPVEQAQLFRFGVELGTSLAAGTTAALVTQLQSELAEHATTKPAPPPPATPEQAPSGFGSKLAALFTGRPGQSAARRVTHSVLAFGATAILLAGGVAAASASGSTTDQSLVAGNEANNSPSASRSQSKAPVVAAPKATSTHKASPKPTTKRTVKAKPKAAAKPKPKPTAKAIALCGAPSNPLRYTFCGGSYVYQPNSGVCNYFNCIPTFWDGSGYMTQCSDGTYSMSGGRSGACSHHGGESRPVYEA